MSITYVIASYAGIEHTSNKDLSKDVLHLQLKQFEKLLINKKSKNVENHILKIVVVTPPCKDEIDGYYRFEEWKEMFEPFESVMIERLQYKGNNKHHSYDQWIQAWMNDESNADFFLLCEDDYFLDFRNSNLDIELMELYHQKFPNNIGYLSTMVDDRYHGYHAAISNGLVSRETVRTLGLDSFYAITNSPYPQVNFSTMFINANIPILDFRNHFRIYFWNSSNDQVENYSRCVSPFHVFIPVQCIALKKLSIIDKDTI